VQRKSEKFTATKSHTLAVCMLLTRARYAGPSYRLPVTQTPPCTARRLRPSWRRTEALQLRNVWRNALSELERWSRLESL